MAAPGERISLANGKLSVPNRPILPYIEGDGTGRDIWRASQAVFDAAVERAYRGQRQIAWMEVLAGEKQATALDAALFRQGLRRVIEHPADKAQAAVVGAAARLPLPRGRAQTAALWGQGPSRTDRRLHANCFD